MTVPRTCRSARLRRARCCESAELGLGTTESCAPACSWTRPVRRYSCLFFVLPLLLLASCKSTYYSLYEKFGVYKRDLLKKQVIATRDEEKATQQQFKDALTRLKELTGFQGGELE